MEQKQSLAINAEKGFSREQKVRDILKMDIFAHCMVPAQVDSCKRSCIKYGSFNSLQINILQSASEDDVFFFSATATVRFHKFKRKFNLKLQQASAVMKEGELVVIQ